MARFYQGAIHAPPSGLNRKPVLHGVKVDGNEAAGRFKDFAA